MKPLTIEELKALEVGDWVWLKDMEFGFSCYVKIAEQHVNGMRVLDKYSAALYIYPDYGTKWLAYKNKEQAEAKGEIVELKEPQIISTDFTEAVIIYQQVITKEDRFKSFQNAERRLAEIKGGKP